MPELTLTLKALNYYYSGEMFLCADFVEDMLGERYPEVTLHLSKTSKSGYDSAVLRHAGHVEYRGTFRIAYFQLNDYIREIMFLETGQMVYFKLERRKETE